MFKPVFLALPVMLAAAMPATAQTDAPAGAPAPMDATAAPALPGGSEALRSLELSTGVQNLSNGFGNWRDVTLKGVYGVDKHVLQGELSAHKRFGENGTFLSLGDTYTFNEDWFGSVALGVGDGAFYLPRYRVDGTISRKFLPGRNLVGTVGAGYYNAPDGHTDRSLSLGAAYYFEAPWIVEGGVRLNRSNPGSVDTQQQFVALTWGRPQQDLVTARYGWGSEGYLAVAANRQLVNFDSREASLTWRHWFNARTGVLVGANRYTNPLYRRSGVNVGVFHEF